MDDEGYRIRFCFVPSTVGPSTMTIENDDKRSCKL